MPIERPTYSLSTAHINEKTFSKSLTRKEAGTLNLTLNVCVLLLLVKPSCYIEQSRCPR